MSRHAWKLPTDSSNKSLWPAVLFMCLLLVMPSGVAFSADVYWTGAVGASWSDAANWENADGSDYDDVVASGDTVHFSDSVTNTDMNNDLENLSGISFVLDGSDNVTLSGNTLVLSGGEAISGDDNGITFDNELTLSADTTFTSDDLTLNGDLNIGGYQLTIDIVEGGNWVIFSCGINGSGTLALIDSTCLIVDSKPGFSGTILLNDKSSLEAQAELSNGDTSLVMNSAEAYVAFCLQYTSEDFESINGSGTLQLHHVDLTVGDGGSDSDFSGDIILDSDATITKDGSGELTLSGGGDSFDGTLVAEDGNLTLDDGFSAGELTLRVAGNGNLVLNTEAEVNLVMDAANVIFLDEGGISRDLTLNMGTLAGSGTIDGNTSLAALAVLSPGGTAPGGFAIFGTLDASDIGVIMVSGDLTLSAASIFNVDIDGMGSGDSGYDRVRVSGAVDVSGAVLNLNWGSTPASDDKFTIILNNGSSAVVGTFDGLDEGDSFDVGGQTMTITYQGGNCNDVIVYGPDADPMDATTVIDHPEDDGGSGLAAPVILPSEEWDMAAEGFSLEWTGVSGAGVYRVYRAASPDGDKTYLGYTADTGWTDATAEPGQTYYYRVRAQGGGATSAYSNYSTGWCLEVNPGITGDLDGDGTDELLWYGAASGQLSYWDTEVASSSYSSPDLFSQIIFSADETSISSDRVDPQNILSPGGDPVTSDQAHLIGLADLDGDGDDEIIWRDLTTGMVTAWVTEKSGAGLQTKTELYLSRRRASVGQHRRHKRRRQGRHSLAQPEHRPALGVENGRRRNSRTMGTGPGRRPHLGIHGRRL